MELPFVVVITAHDDNLQKIRLITITITGQMTYFCEHMAKHKCGGRQTGTIVWLHPGDPEQIPFAGNFEGKAGVVQFFETAFARIDVLEQTIYSSEASGDKVLVVGYEHMRVKDTGKEYQSNWIHMYTLAAGQVIAFEEFIDTAALVSAFSSDE